VVGVIPDEAERSESAEDVADAVSAFRSVVVPARLPQLAGYDIVARYRPHHRMRVGGDFFDVFPLAGGRLGAIIGDVQGKGPWAGAASVTARWTIRSAMVDGAMPAEALDLANRVLLDRTPDAEEGLFCTAAIAHLAPQRGLVRATFAVAGHPKPRVLRPSGTLVTAGSTGGGLLGVFETTRFADARLQLGVGDRVVLFTDGVTDVGGAQDGDEALDHLLRTFWWHDGAEVARHVEALPLQEGETHRDDVAVVVLTVLTRREPGASLVVFPG
jgi:sigma-B regulation protein RsbU (phosphoserine phosphatase)